MDRRVPRDTSPRAPTFAPSGVLVVDKPKGPTSHDVVATIRRLLRTREVGHAGTLDPMATGVLVVAVGEGTKLVPYLTAQDKAYVADLALGAETDTLDAEGTVTREAPLDEGLRAELGAGGGPKLFQALDIEGARTAQVPPAFSAIKVDGERAHARARRGDALELPPRPVSVRHLELIAAGTHPTPFVRVGLRVAKGYYVRAFARDFAEALGTYAHLTALRRVRSGVFDVSDSGVLTLGGDDLGERARRALLPLAVAAARTMPTVTLGAEAVAAARCGKPVPAPSFLEARAEPVAFLAEDGALVAIGEAVGGGVGRVLRGFRAPQPAREEPPPGEPPRDEPPQDEPPREG